MSSNINIAIDRLVTDEHLRAQVLSDGPSALSGFQLEVSEAVAVSDAVIADGGQAPFTHLRAQARFEPLFAAASASATKIG